MQKMNIHILLQFSVLFLCCCWNIFHFALFFLLCILLFLFVLSSSSLLPLIWMNKEKNTVVAVGPSIAAPFRHGVCVCVLWRLPHESPVWIAANVPCSPFKCTTCGPHIVLLPLLLCRTGVGKIISLHIYSLFLLSSKHRKQKQNDFFSAIRCRLSNHSPPQHNRYVPT